MKNRFSNWSRQSSRMACLLAICGLIYSCNDDSMLDDQTTILTSSNIYDGSSVNKIGLGSGCDITQEIGNCKAQILDFEKLKNADAVDVDPTQEKFKIIRTGKNYAEMTQNINAALANGRALDFVSMPFSWNLSSSLKSKIGELDIYEYGVTMFVNKIYSLSIKPEKYSQLRDFISDTVWEEINATDENDRTDISAIMKLYEKYGTHISTKAFYGALYQYSFFREQVEWESSIEAQMQIGINRKCPIPETGIIISGNNVTSTSSTDSECYKNSSKEEIERRIGGNANIADMNEWFNSCTPGDPNSCALLGHSLCSESADNGGLVALYELFDESDPRRKAMQEALVEYEETKGIILTSSPLVIIDAFGKHFEAGKPPYYLYQDYDGKKLMYYRLDEEISKHVKGVTKGKFYFYYSLGHLTDKAVVDIKFADSGDIDGDWKTRGDHANTGVSGDVKDRYLCIKTKNVKNGVPRSEFVTGFGVEVDGKIKSISKYTSSNYNWAHNGESWYKGLLHDDVYCIYTKDELEDFRSF